MSDSKLVAEKAARKAEKARKKAEKTKSEADGGVKSKEAKGDKKDKEGKKDKKDEKDKKDKKDKKEKKDKSEKKDKKDKKDKENLSRPSEPEAAPKVDPRTAEVKTSAASPGAVAKFLKDSAVSVEMPASLSSLDPVLDIKSVSVGPELQSVLAKFSKPTPIQSASWPHLLAGRDVIGVAETGSGKTLAFGLPAVDKLLNSHDGSTALVVSPTRELAMQIYDQFEIMLAEVPQIKAVCLYGGVPKYEQQQQLRDKRVKIVVGTPGRLRDLLADGSLRLNNCRYLVLDEADRMLEKGFEQDIKEIISSAPQERQTVMFTATWPPEVRALASTLMARDVVKVSIGEVDELHANKRITQYVDVVEPMQKERRFLDLLRKYARGNDKVLVFALYKKEASRIERLLQNQGYAVAAVHGDLSQQQRTKALGEFKAGTTNLMLATDVAARGLDIPAVKVVINLTFPLTVEDYVHRIGRTGRAGQTGIAHTLFTEQEKHLAGALMNVLRDADQKVPEELMKFGSHTKKKEHSLYGAFFKDIDPGQKAKKVKFD